MLAILASILGVYGFVAVCVFAWLARTPMDSREAAVTSLYWPYIVVGLMFELGRDLWIRWND